jgi:Na+-translocating ferredoxin:NAD+ oxidoreductase RnfA subunit
MELLLLQFANQVMSGGITAAAQVTEGAIPSDKIGFVVLGVILGPVFLLTLAAMIERPRKSRIPELFLGSFILLISAMVIGFAVIGFALKFVVPQ